MEAFVCETCGAHYPAAAAPPDRCLICADERQYVGWDGQRWLTMSHLAADHHADIREEEDGLTGIGIQPGFAIGQRALLVQTPGGNVLWDCIALLDEEIEALIKARGGLSAIAVSHPHFYTAMVEYSHAFDAPVYLHDDDRQWVTRPDDRLVFWSGEARELEPGVTLLRLGGHFEGATALHWAAGHGGRGALLSGDVVSVVPDRRWVSFMRSYPNLIPLAPGQVEGIVAALRPYEFERIYGGWYGRVVASDGKAAVERSAARYVRAVRE